MSENRFAAKRMTQLPVYAIQRMFLIAKEMELSGEEVIHLEFGEPDLGTPRFIVDAAYKAMKDGYTRYTSSMGLIELREAITEKLLATRDIEVDPRSEVIILPGSKHAIYCSLVATLNSGEEVIITDPCFPPYEFAINLVGGKPVKIPLKEDCKFRLDPEEVENHVTSKTKMVLLNFPNNPVGSILTKRVVETLSEIAQQHDLLVLSDDVYEDFIYDQERFYSMVSYPGMRERTIIVNSFSKKYAMTGWRLGYVVAARNIVERIRKVQESTTTCASPFCQIAGVEALEKGNRFIKMMVNEFSRRREVLVDGLNKIDGISCRMPEGAFYAFPNVTGFGISSDELSEYLLKEAKVVTVPGSAFGKHGAGYLRISYANSIENIRKALEQMEEVLDNERLHQRTLGGRTCSH